jgi:site-specific DNA-methyltransferase (adenine-specific)
MEVNKIYNLDCRDGFSLIEDNFADLIITDPPYEVQAQGCGGGKNKWNGGSRFKGGNSVFGVEESQDKLFEYVKPKDYMTELSRIIKPDGHVYIFTNDKNLAEMQSEAEKNKLKLMNILVVNKLQGTYFSYYQKYIEFILFFRSTKGKAKYINNCGKGNYFEYRYSRGKEKLHPSEKPLDLIKELILQSSQEGEIIFDSFMGSGTTAVASIETGRKYIGFELDNTYYEIAQKRINEHILNKNNN